MFIPRAIHHFESLREGRPSIQEEQVSERQDRYKSLDCSFSSLRQNSVSYMMDTRDKALHADGINRCNWHISRRLMPGPSLLIQLKANVVVKSVNNTIRSSQKRPPVQVVLHPITASLPVLYVIPEDAIFLLCSRHTLIHTSTQAIQITKSPNQLTEASFIVIVIVHLVLL